jgi:hypothetical protein
MNLPKLVKIFMVLIDRVGFPIVAFLLMCFVAYKAIENIKENTKVLVEISTSISDFHNISHIEHMEMLRELHRK